MKKILFVIPNLKMGGVQRVTSVIANELNKHVEVDMLIYDLSDKFYTIDIKNNYVLSKLEYYRFLSGKALRKIAYSSFKKTINPKIVHTSIVRKISKLQNDNHYDTIVLIASSLLMSTELKKKYNNVKIISWTHNSADTYFNNYFKREGIYFNEALNKSDLVVTLTQSDKIEYGKYNSNTVQIFNPLTIENKNVSNLKNKNISFVGRISIEHKGIDYLCELASKLPNDWTISVAGNGSENELKKFNKLLTKYNVNNKVIFKGELKDDELKKHFLDSSLYIMTSRWEGFGLVLVEAMSFGLPIVAFEQTGSAEVLENGNFGILINNGDVNSMVNKINQFIENIELREEYSKKSLYRVENFKIENIIQKWLDII